MSTSISHIGQNQSRLGNMLRTALGAEIAAWLAEPQIVEIMLNPDGRLWLDRLDTGLLETSSTLSAADGERIIRLVAHHVGAEAHAGSPRVFQLNFHKPVNASKACYRHFLLRHVLQSANLPSRCLA